MFINDICIVWGEVVQFDRAEKKMAMVYYGLNIKGLFLGWGWLFSKNDKPTSYPQLKKAYI